VWGPLKMLRIPQDPTGRAGLSELKSYTLDLSSIEWRSSSRASSQCRQFVLTCLVCCSQAALVSTEVFEKVKGGSVAFSDKGPPLWYAGVEGWPSSDGEGGDKGLFSRSWAGGGGGGSGTGVAASAVLQPLPAALTRPVHRSLSAAAAQRAAEMPHDLPLMCCLKALALARCITCISRARALLQGSGSARAAARG